MQHLDFDQHKHLCLGCLIQVTRAAGIEQPPGQLRRLEAALRPPFDVVLAPAPLDVGLHRFWGFDQRQQSCVAALIAWIKQLLLAAGRATH